MRAFTFSVFALGLLAACGTNTDDMAPFGAATISPAEQAVTPANPLQRPPTLDLPPPTPGQGNRADRR
ncbi:MAG: DUF3035 domain-containing protein [Loktanella sp.]|nr:DUF3035 domain-containing protein [Loktanella sp.]